MMLEPGFGWWGLCSAAWRGAARLLGVKIGVVTFYIGILTTSWLAPYTSHNKHTVESFLINMLPQQRMVFRSEQCREKIWGHILMHTT